MSQLLVVNPIISYCYDDRYTAQSVLCFAFSVALLFSFWRKGKALEPAAEAFGAAPAAPAA